MSVRLGFPNLAGTAPDAAAPLPIGAQIEAHSVLQVLSEGPNGFVYLTRDAAHGATRVLKEFMPRSRLLRLSDGSVRPCDVSDSIATSVARIAFMNEANTLAAFQHPALIRVLGVIPAHRTLYRVMPLVDGVSLEQHCRTRAEPPSLAWLHGLVDGLLQALEVLHERRLGHGSVKPGQVMVRESGLPVLLGFASVARELDTVLPTQWQSPGAAHLTRHAPPAPADDLPALAEAAYFAATGLAAPTLQQRLDGMPVDVGAALDGLSDDPGAAARQRRRGLLLALEAALTPATHARPQSVAEFRHLLKGDAPTRGGRHVPTPRWVGEMPERDETEVDLLISQPVPLSEDLQPARRLVTAAAALAPPEVAQPAPAMQSAPASTTAPAPDLHPAVVPEIASEDRGVADVRAVPETAWPFEPEPEVPWQEPAARVLSERKVVPPAPVEAPVADAHDVSEREPAAVVARPEPALGDAAESESEFEPSFEPPGRRRNERDFAATEFLVASTEPSVAFGPSSQVPAAEQLDSSLRPQPLVRPRSRSAAMAAVVVLALVGVGIAAWWQADSGPTQVAGAPSAPQAPVPDAAPSDKASPVLPGAAVPGAAPPEVAAAPPAVPPMPMPPPTPADATAAVTAPTPGPSDAPPPADPVLPAGATVTLPPTMPTAPPDPAPAEAPTAGTAAAPAPAATVAPAIPSRSTLNDGGVASPPAARPTAPQRTAAAATRSAKPAPRANGSNARTPPTAPAASRSSLRARSPLAACGNRTQFSLVYCMQQQCARPAYQAHPQCADLRNGG